MAGDQQAGRGGRQLELLGSISPEQQLSLRFERVSAFVPARVQPPSMLELAMARARRKQQGGKRAGSEGTAGGPLVNGAAGDGPSTSQPDPHTSSPEMKQVGTSVATWWSFGPSLVYPVKISSVRCHTAALIFRSRSVPHRVC